MVALKHDLDLFLKGQGEDRGGQGQQDVCKVPSPK